MNGGCRRDEVLNFDLFGIWDAWESTTNGNQSPLPYALYFLYSHTCTHHKEGCCACYI